MDFTFNFIPKNVKIEQRWIPFYLGCFFFFFFFFQFCNVIEVAIIHKMISLDLAID